MGFTKLLDYGIPSPERQRESKDTMKPWRISFFVAVVLLTGCTTSVQLGSSAGKNKTINERGYELGKTFTVHVGDPILFRKSFKARLEKKFFTAQNDFALTGGILSTRIKLKASEGDKFTVLGKNELGNPVVLIPGEYFMFGINGEGRWDKTVMAPSFWLSPIGSGRQYKMRPENTVFQPVCVEAPTSKHNYINHEITFTGLGANGITLSYREYTFESRGQSALDQPLVYPLNSKKIRVKNYVIKIISVSASELVYVIESDT